MCQPRILDLLRAEVPAVHDRHPQIEYDQVGRRCLIQVVQSLPAIARRHRAITLHLKKSDHRFARVFVVLDDEDFGILPLFVAVHKTHCTRYWLSPILLVRLRLAAHEIAEAPTRWGGRLLSVKLSGVPTSHSRE